MKNYRELAEAGQISEHESAQMQAARDAARITARDLMAGAGDSVEPVAFGFLDTIAVRLVAWYGPEAARDVFAHYAEVCGRQPAPAKIRQAE